MRNYLKGLRKKRGVTQEQVAIGLGIQSSYYNMIENGNRQKKMDVVLIFKLASCFDVPVEYIVQEEQKWYEAS